MTSQSPITNRWGKTNPKRIDVKHSNVFTGVEGWAFNHQAQVTSLDGVLYASWTKGIRDEESPGETTAYATSEDNGVTWSSPRTIGERAAGQFDDRVMVNSGIRVHDGMLTAYYGDWEYSSEVLAEKGVLKGIEFGDTTFYTNLDRAVASGHIYANCRGHLNCVTRARTSSDGGATWSEPIDIFPRLATYHSPEPTKSGRLIMPGHATFPYTDDPKGLTGWTKAGLTGLSEDYVDSVMGWFFGRDARKDPVIYSEGSFFQTDDGILHMMLRTEADWYAVSDSADDGETWSEPLRTDYTDSIGRPHFGRLPDGRFFGLNCPAPGRKRTPVVLALSDDGVVFDKHFILGDEPWRPMRIPGFAKGGRYGYPWLHFDGEWGYVIYSTEKEDIGIGVFRLADLK